MAEHVISVNVPLNICSVPVHNNNYCTVGISTYISVPTVTVKLSSYHLLVESIREATKSVHKIMMIMLESNEDNSIYCNSN